MSTKYAYKYNPNEKAKQWLDAQQNKSKSLDLIIEQIIANFGNNDIFQEAANQMLRSSKQETNHQEPVQSEQYETTQPQYQNSFEEPTQQKPVSNPNLGFLSK